MLKWLAGRTLNQFDGICGFVAGAMCATEHYLTFLAIALISPVVSVLLERWAAARTLTATPPVE